MLCSLLFALVEPSVYAHPAAHRPPAIDETRQEIGYLKHQHADERVRARLAEDRADGRLRVAPVDHSIQPHKYDRMGDGRCEEHERPGERPGHDELAADDPRDEAHDGLRQAADADDALRADGARVR